VSGVVERIDIGQRGILGVDLINMNRVAPEAQTRNHEQKICYTVE
jgi:hypothetical protein